MILLMAVSFKFKRERLLTKLSKNYRIYHVVGMLHWSSIFSLVVYKGMASAAKDVSLENSLIGCVHLICADTRGSISQTQLLLTNDHSGQQKPIATDRFWPILLKKSAMVSATEKYASEIEIFTFGRGCQAQISRSSV